MTIESKIRDEKLKYDINRETAKISALSSDKIDKHKYLTSEEILTSSQSQMIEQVKFFVTTFSTIAHATLFQQLKRGFKKPINWSKYQSKAQLFSLLNLSKFSWSK